ncbi:multidrug effflux MFS transporter [Quadrisphaera sp. DSM 44207]|uniref:multidrug effflux MFS transporter n=1 Tax=Quadrisphaera sp. DSM 44207 TaxID=1881057 RepID=UPI00088F87AA|nr:multidrug effflux MFS transporter [Quadrisphaera sp. DSM 44207]SDQ87776.1 MFS transporter, DHA1 family, bicyclomycin/chloramphenicol resistance protein [Quadrisphaera sp. DSM 44207]
MTTSDTLLPARTRAAIPPDRDFSALPLGRRVGWVVLLGSLTALGAFTIDLYLPAFPVLQAELSTSASAVQLTLTGTLVGLALGQLVLGPLSDALGRKRPLLAGLALHALASLAAVAAPTVTVLGITRVLQGVGTAAASVVAMAVVRDLFDGSGAARLISRLMLVIGVAPVFAPTVGSALMEVTSWRGIFAVLAGLSLVLGLAVALVLPETLPAHRRRSSGLRSTLGAYRELLGDRAMVGLVLVAGLTMAALFGYVSGSSFVFQEQYGMSAQQFGLVFAVGGVAIVAGTQTSAALVERVEPQRLLAASLAAGVVAALVLLAGTSGWLGVWGVAVPLWTALFFVGLGFPSAPALALARHGRAAGTAAAMLGAVQFGVGAVSAPLVGLLGGSPALGMALVVVTGLALALAVLLVVVLPALRRPAPAA